jgi:hypothetical protein
VTPTVTVKIKKAPIRSNPVIGLEKINSSAKKPYNTTIYPSTDTKPDESF